MAVPSKRARKDYDSDSEFEDDDDIDSDELDMEQEEDEFDDGEDVDGESEHDGEDGEEEDHGDEENGDGQNVNRDAELEELDREYKELRDREQDLLKNLKRHKDEDLLKGQAVKNQKALWDKTLEFRFLLQKPFSSSDAYSDLVLSSKKTLDSLVELKEVLLEKNLSIVQSTNSKSRQTKHSESSKNTDADGDEDWSWISWLISSIATFRNKSIDKWQRKTQVTTGAAAIKSRLHAFNQNVSEHVAQYMRDLSTMGRQMQMMKSAVGVFGAVDADPELLDDSDFYQQLPKEFFETLDQASSDTAFCSLKKLQIKKRKIVDRGASKSRKIRYNVHEKIVNFLAREPMPVAPMLPDLNNLFGPKNQRPASVV